MGSYNASEYKGVLKKGYKLKKKVEKLFEPKRDSEGYIILEWKEGFDEEDEKIDDLRGGRED